MSGDTRAVWLDDNDRNVLVWAMNHSHAHGLSGWSADLTALISQYEAAPADPVEACESCITSSGIDRDCDRELIQDILAALRHPGVAASPETDT